MGNKGLHNTLEAAVYGIPIIIGKNFQGIQKPLKWKNLGCCLFQQKRIQRYMGKTNK